MTGDEATTPEPSDLTRLSVNLDSETSQKLQELAVHIGGRAPLTDAIRRAVLVYHFLWRLKQRRKHFFIGNRRGDIDREFVLEH